MTASNATRTRHGRPDSDRFGTVLALAFMVPVVLAAGLVAAAPAAGLAWRIFRWPARPVNVDDDRCQGCGVRDARYRVRTGDGDHRRLCAACTFAVFDAGSTAA